MNLLNRINSLYLRLTLFYKLTPSYLYYKVLKAMFRSMVLAKGPSSSVIALTYRCQCNCIHCSAGLYHKVMDREMELKQWYEILDYIASQGIPRINITGGEALLRSDIFEIIEYAAQNSVVILETNGLLLTQENVYKLKKSKVSCIAISLDNINKNIHDELRLKPGCYDSIIKGISLLKDNQIPIILSTYLTSANCSKEYLKSFCDYADKLGVDALRILPSRPAGNFYESHEKLLKEKDFDKINTFIDHKIAYFNGIPSPKCCGAYTKETFYISPYGEVQLCPYLPIKFGNVIHESIEIILQKMWGHNIFKQKDRKCLVLNKSFRNKFLKEELKEQLPFEVN